MESQEQAAIEKFLGDRPSSEQLRQWRDTLATRAERLRRELKEANPAQAPALRHRLAEMKRQIAALEQEQMITEFVEDSVRVTLAMGSINEGERLEE
jgi:phage terminase Nu1 subunit (DNA packaging protein)